MTATLGLALAGLSIGGCASPEKTAFLRQMRSEVPPGDDHGREVITAFGLQESADEVVAGTATP